MADKRKSGKRRKDDFASDATHGVAEKASKDEYAVAKWLRSNVPRKKTKFLNYQVEYFTGSKAVDALLDSKWTKGKSPLFTERIEVIDFLQEMLAHKFFHRAKKVPVTEQELKGHKKKKDGDKSDKEDDKKKKDVKHDGDKSTNSAAEAKESKEAKEAKDKEKRKRKIRLEMHMDQLFVDGGDAYVWIYDPIPLHYWLAGLGLLLGAIGVCLFPLWPPTVRKGVYYLSLAAAGFLVLIIALVILRLIIFCLIWVLTLSKHHLWILPNLTEDVSFFASFWPLYKYEYKGGETSSKDKNKKKKKKDKNSDNEAEDDKARLLEEKQENIQEEQTGSATNEPAESAAVENNTESESESSQRSSTGKDFEMVDAGDVDTS